MESLFLVGVAAFVAGSLTTLVGLVVVKGTFVRVPDGSALVVFGTGAPRVTFRSAFVLPVVQKAELIDVSLKSLEIRRTGRDGVLCADNIRADFAMTFYLRVNPTAEDILKVAESVGCSRATLPDTIEALFTAKFSEAIKTVLYAMDFEQAHARRDELRDAVLMTIGQDLIGYSLEDAAIDLFEMTDEEHLDPNNFLDARGLERRAELLAAATGASKDEEV